MKTAAQPTLFDRQQPASIECHGSELAAVCADLKARGWTRLEQFKELYGDGANLVAIEATPTAQPGDVWRSSLVQARR